MPDDSTAGDVTALLRRLTAGDSDARRELMTRIYPDLKRIAECRMRGERKDHTLQATALISEFFLQLARRQECVWQNRAHFLAVASQAMKRLLIDYARSHSAAKRGGGRPEIQIDGIKLSTHHEGIDILDFSRLLDRLSSEEPRMARVLEMRCFGGLTNREIADLLAVDERTVKRDWQLARAWIVGRLRGGGSCDGRGLGEH